MLIFFKHIYSKYLSSYESAYLLSIFALFILLLLTGVLNLLVPFVLAFIVAYLLQGLLQGMVNHTKISNSLALTLVFSLFMFVLVGSLLLIVPILYQQTSSIVSKLPDYFSQLSVLLKTNIQHISGIEELIKTYQIEQKIQLLLSSSIKVIFSKSISSIDSVLLFMAYLVIVPTLVFFMLKDKKYLTSLLKSWLLIHEKPTGQLLIITKEINTQIMSYVRGKFIESVVIGVATYIAFVSFGLQYAEILAVGVGLSVFIPYAGIVIATIPVFLLALLQFGLGQYLYWFLGLYALLQLLDANILVPVLFSEAVHIHPLIIILAIVLAGSMFGIWGVFFAIPFAVVMKATIKNWPIQ